MATPTPTTNKKRKSETQHETPSEPRRVITPSSGTGTTASEPLQDTYFNHSTISNLELMTILWAAHYGPDKEKTYRPKWIRREWRNRKRKVPEEGSKEWEQLMNLRP